MDNKKISVSYIITERTGKYFRLFSMNIYGIKYYFIGSIRAGGFRWRYTDKEEAIKEFERIENYAENTKE